MSQKDRVLSILKERAADGLSAREAIYDLHITRLAAIIFALRQEGWRIESEIVKGTTARYWLVGVLKARNASPCGACGHVRRRHVADMRCLDYTGDGILVRECPCEKFQEATEVLA